MPFDGPAMRKDKIRYLVTRSGAQGDLPRHYWQPSAALAALGWQAQRVPLNWGDYATADALYAAAASRAIALNADLDRTREGSALSAARPAPAVARNFDNLIAAYKADKAYLDLSPKTRRDYDQCLARIADWAGDCLLAAVDKDRVANFHAGIALRAPSMANATIRVLRLLLNWGMANTRTGGGRWLVENPAAKPGLVGRPVSGRIWPRAAVAAWVAKADALGLWSIGAAVVLDEWLGQREADILRMPRTIWREGRLIFRQAKGTSLRKRTQGAGVVLSVDQVPALVDRLTAELKRQDARHAAWAAKNPRHVIPLNIIQSEETGAAYKPDNFRHVFARVRGAVEADMLRAAGWAFDDTAKAWINPDVTRRTGNLPKREREAAIEAARRDAASFDIDYLLPDRDMADPGAFRLYIGELQFMHLRHTAITRLAESGCSNDEIAGVSGHSLKTVQDILERYMLRTASLSRTAFAKRRAKEIADG